MVLALASIGKNNLNTPMQYFGDRVPAPQVIALPANIGSRISPPASTLRGPPSEPATLPVLLKEDLGCVPVAARPVKPDLRLRLGIEVAASKGSLAVAHFDETFSVSVEGRCLAVMAFEMRCYIVGHNCSLTVSKDPSFGQGHANSKRNPSYVTQSVHLAVLSFQGMLVHWYPPGGSRQPGLLHYFGGYVWWNEY